MMCSIRDIASWNVRASISSVRKESTSVLLPCDDNPEEACSVMAALDPASSVSFSYNISVVLATEYLCLARAGSHRVPASPVATYWAARPMRLPRRREPRSLT